MNNKTLIFAALIIAAVIYLTACSDTRAQQPAPALAYTTSTADTVKPAQTATAQATTTSTAAATICPTSYTPKRGALAGQPQTVHTGSRGGCYYFNASGTKTYLKK